MAKVSASGTLSLRPGERRVVGNTEIAVLETTADGRVTLRIGPAGRCERRATLAPGERLVAGGLTVAVGKNTTSGLAEIFVS